MSKHENWYAIYTYPNREKKVYKELNKHGITSSLPIRKEIRLWHDRKKQIEVPIFPTYVFVKVPPQEMWMVLAVQGVVRFITFEGKPALVRDSEIELINKLVAEYNTVRCEEAPYVKGEKVQIIQGPFKGLTGNVGNSKGLTKVYIELETVHQTISIELDSTLLSKVQDVQRNDYKPAAVLARYP